MTADAAALDRLPWLAEERQPAKRRRGRLLPLAAFAIVATGGIWVAARSIDRSESGSSKRLATSTTARLPPPHPAAPRETRVATQPDVPSAPPLEFRRVPAAKKSTATPLPARKAVGHKIEKQTAASKKQLEPRHPQVAAPTNGRSVQIGAFGSAAQAKDGWRFMLRAYPAMAHLPWAVRTARNSKGRTFHRFQIDTTSQAHSEVLCQRMQKIHLSCAVIGVPSKTKVER